MLTYGTRKLEQFKCLLKRDAFYELACSKACILSVFSLSLLYVWSVLSETGYKRLAVLWIHSKISAYVIVFFIA